MLNEKDMVALVPARPTHDAVAGINAEAVNKRLAESERTPTAAWVSGDAGRIAKGIVRKKAAR